MLEPLRLKSDASFSLANCHLGFTNNEEKCSGDRVCSFTGVINLLLTDTLRCKKPLNSPWIQQSMLPMWCQIEQEWHRCCQETILPPFTASNSGKVTDTVTYDHQIHLILSSHLSFSRCLVLDWHIKCSFNCVMKVSWVQRSVDCKRYIKLVNLNPGRNL